MRILGFSFFFFIVLRRSCRGRASVMPLMPGLRGASRRRRSHGDRCAGGGGGDERFTCGLPQHVVGAGVEPLREFRTAHPDDRDPVALIPCEAMSALPCSLRGIRQPDPGSPCGSRVRTVFIPTAKRLRLGAQVAQPGSTSVNSIEDPAHHRRSRPPRRPRRVIAGN